MSTRHMTRRSRERIVMHEELFRHIVAEERRRANRSNQPLVVMTITANAFRGAVAQRVWSQAVDAVSTHIRETDVVGWLHQQTAIGIILHDVRAIDAPPVQELEARVRQELATHLDPNVAGRFATRFHVLPAGGNQVQRSAERSLLLTTRPAHSGYDWLKRLLDFAGALTLLVLLAPLFLVIAALVKLKSPGPVFFRQPRIGRQMKPFAMLKFRTMHVNADPRLHQEFVSRFISTNGQDPECLKNGIFKIVDDPRVTPVGRVLRKTSLDELPQLWNVVRGDMSLVGPRPPLPYEVEQYKQWHTRRLVEAKPGITGLWQVGGRSRTTFDDMVRLDLRYARARSVWMDFKILLATPGAVFSGKGAC